MSGIQFKELSIKKCKNGFLVKEPTSLSPEYVFNSFDNVQQHLYNFFEVEVKKILSLSEENIFWQSFSIIYSPILSINKYRVIQYFDGSTLLSARECKSLEDCIKIIIKGSNL